MSQSNRDFVDSLPLVDLTPEERSDVLLHATWVVVGLWPGMIPSGWLPRVDIHPGWDAPGLEVAYKAVNSFIVQAARVAPPHKDLSLVRSVLYHLLHIRGKRHPAYTTLIGARDRLIEALTAMDSRQGEHTLREEIEKEVQRRLPTAVSYTEAEIYKLSNDQRKRLLYEVIGMLGTHSNMLRNVLTGVLMDTHPYSSNVLILRLTNGVLDYQAPVQRAKMVSRLTAAYELVKNLQPPKQGEHAHG